MTKNKRRKYLEIRKELDEVLADMQTLNNDVDRALELHKKGTILLEELSDYLKNAENIIKTFKTK